MFFIRRLEVSSAGGKFFRLRGMIDPNTPFDKVYLYGRTGVPPKRYKFRPKKSYFYWDRKKWERFLKCNIGHGVFYCYFGGGFYVTGFLVRKKGRKIKIRKKFKGIILPLFLGPVN